MTTNFDSTLATSLARQAREELDAEHGPSRIVLADMADQLDAASADLARNNVRLEQSHKAVIQLSKEAGDWRDAVDQLTNDRDSLRSALSSSRSECEELKKERDEAIENRQQMVELRRRDVQLIGELETARSENGSIFSNVNDAIGRAGIHCAITFWEAIDQIAAERDSARAELAKMRLVMRDFIDVISVCEQQRKARGTGNMGADLPGEPLSYVQPSAFAELTKFARMFDSATKGPADE